MSKLALKHLHGSISWSDHTEQVEVLNQLPLGAGLVRGTEDIGQETTGQEARGNAISLDFAVIKAAGHVTTTALGLSLVDSEGGVVLGLSSNAEGEGKGGSEDSSEVHFGGCREEKDNGERFFNFLACLMIEMKTGGTWEVLYS